MKDEVFQEGCKMIEKFCRRLKQMADSDSPQVVFCRQSIQRVGSEVVKMLQRHNKAIFPPALFSFYDRGIKTDQMEVPAGPEPAADVPEVLMEVINMLNN